MSEFDLDQMEARVMTRYCEKISEVWPTPPDAFHTVEFSPEWAAAVKHVSVAGKTIEASTVGQPLPPMLQFPREQWVVYPNRRKVSLLIVDRLLDKWDSLTTEQKAQAAFLLHFGGTERVA